MRVDELMTADPVAVAPGTPIVEAARLLLGRNVTALPVVSEQGELVGIVSRSDLLRHRVVADPRSHLRPLPPDESEPPHTVADAMTTPVLTLPTSADEAEAAHLMLGRQIKSVPVISQGRLVGIVSVTDILRSKLRIDAEIAEDIKQRLREFAGTQGWAVRVEDGVVTITSSGPEKQRQVLHLLALTVPGVVRVHAAAPTRTDPGPSSRR